MRPSSNFNLNCTWEVFKRHYKYKAKGIHPYTERKKGGDDKVDESEKKNKVKEERISCIEKEKFYFGMKR